jgi:hypothetical protein
LLVCVFAAQAYQSQRTALVKAQEQLAGVASAKAAEPATLLAFEIKGEKGPQLATADLCDAEVALLYVFSGDARNTQLESQLQAAAQTNPRRVKVVPVRIGDPKAPLPAGIEKLGKVVSDPDGTLTSGYKVQELPAVVVLKDRPVYHQQLTAQAANTTAVEEMVDLLLAREDLKPMPTGSGGCGGGCGAGGGTCAGEAAMAAHGGACAGH